MVGSGTCLHPAGLEGSQFTMTVPIVIFRGLRQSHAQGHGELGTPHFPGYTPAWWNPKLNHLYSYTVLYLYLVV